MKIRSLLLIILFFVGFTLFAQDESIDSLYRIETYIFPKLPPFPLLFDSIMSRSPQKLKLQDAKQDALYSAGLTKKDWMNFISMSASFNYGKGGALGSTTTATGLVTSSFSNTVNSTYGGGIGVGFSLGALLNYKTKVRMAKLKVNQSQYELDIYAQELRYKLFEEYLKLESNIEAFKANSILMEMNNAQIILSEKEFRLGRINLQSLIGARQSYIGSVSTYETLKQNCKLGLFYFEQLSGIDFRKDNSVKTEQTPPEQ